MERRPQVVSESNSPALSGVALRQYIETEHPINLAISAIPIRFENGVPIFSVPPGIAQGCFDLRNRGRELFVEITCWPSNRTQSFSLTTGGSEPKHLRIGAYEKWLAVIVDARIKYADKMAVTESLMAEVLEISGLELQQMLDRWYERSFKLSGLDSGGAAGGKVQRNRGQIETMLRAGIKPGQIAQEVGCNRRSIYQIHGEMKHKFAEAQA